MLTIILVIILVAVLIILLSSSQKMSYMTTNNEVEHFFYYPNCLETMWSGVRCFPPYGYTPFRGYADPSNPYTDYLY